MYKKLLFLTFVLVLSLAYSSYGDGLPPRPNPMRWYIQPTATGPNTVIMSVPTALDAGSDYPVSYYFEEPNTPSINSGWISDPNWTATGLDSNTVYYFRARAKDSIGNTTQWTGVGTRPLTIPTTTPPLSTPPAFRLDFNRAIDNNDANTQPGFGMFIPAYSGSEVNGVVVDIGGNILSSRRADPCYGWSRYGITTSSTTDPCFMSFRAAEFIVRDMISAVQGSGITVTLWGLGVNRDVNITLWAIDSTITGPSRTARWYANGQYLFDANFTGGSEYWPQYINQDGAVGWVDYYKYANKAKATTDQFGRIELTCTRGPNSPAAEPYSYINALQIEPSTAPFVETPYAHRPIPLINAPTCVPVNALLKWRNGATIGGAGTPTHNLYFGDVLADVTAADANNYGSYPGVLIFASLAKDANSGYDPYGVSEFLALDQTYYWRVDEVPGIFKGEVWRFTTCPNSVADNFNSYSQSSDMRLVWKDYWTNGTRAEVLMTGTDPNRDYPPHNQRSMRYLYKNWLSPYYAKAETTLGSATSGGKPTQLNIDKNWTDMDAKSVQIWFWGRTTNDANQKMYMILTDGSANSAKVLYSGDMNDIRVTGWHEWNILLEDDFQGVNPSLNLNDISKVAIQFGGDGVNGINDGFEDYVIFEDLQLWTTRCALIERDANFAQLDFAPGGSPSGDCVINYGEIDTIAGAWLDRDLLINTTRPGDSNLVIWYPINEMDGNKIWRHTDTNNPDVCEPQLNGNGLWTGTFWNSTNSASTPAGYYGTCWGDLPGYDGNGCAYMNGSQGSRIQCGDPCRFGQLGLGIGGRLSGLTSCAGDVNAITLSAWVKWLGPRTWDSYLMTKCQGVLGKRNAWDDTGMVWMLEIDTGGNQRGFGLRQREQAVYSPNNQMMPFIGQWVHLAATYPNPAATYPADANAWARLFLNGGQVNAGLWRFSRGPDPNIYLTVGETQDQNAWPDCPESFYGYIDEVRIYNRALDQNEIGYLADRTPADNLLWVAIPSPAEVYSQEAEGSKVINFKDFAMTVKQWLTEQMYPRD